MSRLLGIACLLLSPVTLISAILVSATLVSATEVAASERYWSAPAQPGMVQGQPGSLYDFQPEFEAVIRGQTPQTYDLGPQYGQPGMQPGVQYGQPGVQYGQPGMPSDPYFGGGMPQGTMPPQQGMPPGAIYNSPYDTNMQFQQPGYDPFMGGANNGMMMPQQGATMFGINGPQPARLGWSHRWDFEYVFPSNINGGGRVDEFAVDWAADYTTQGPNGWLWTLTPEVNYRNFNFENIGHPVAAGGISDNYYRFAYRFQTTSPSQGPLNYRFGFTPALATDFQRQLNSQAWNFDVDATLYYRSAPNWMWVLGAMYWDRADDIILPHAGVVWTPNQFLEIRAVYPNPRIDYFIGTPFGLATWLYGGAEYNVESFQAGEVDGSKPQLQIEEWRAFAGLRWETCTFSSNVDFGYVFDRRWRVHSGAGMSDISPGGAFMIRYGVRY